MAPHAPPTTASTARPGPSLARGLSPTVSIPEAAELLGISVRTTYRAAATGDIPTIRFGRRLRVPTARLLELLGVSADELVGTSVDAST